MRKKGNFSYIFILLIIFSILILILSSFGALKDLTSVLGKISSPFQYAIYKVLFSPISGIGKTQELENLKEENIRLSKILIDVESFKRENSALRDQFELSQSKAKTLLPAGIIGAPGFVPGVSEPETLTLNVGSENGVAVGDIVVFKNNLIGKITNTYSALSKVILVSNPLSSFTAKNSTSKALGVIKGGGNGKMIFDNVVLSENIKPGDLILTNGDVNGNGGGYPPDLIVGKISSIDKKASSLFQRGEVKSLIDFGSLSTVFILKNSR